MKQIIPERDRETGGYTFTLHGYTPAPTSNDGYDVTATVQLDTDGGAAVTRLVIEPSEGILEAGRYRPREADEMRRSPINTSVLGLIRFTAIINRIVEVEEMYALAVAEDPAMSAEARKRLENLKKRGPRNNDAKHARHAQQVLECMSQGRGYQARLKNLYPDDWWVGSSGVRKRISRLREDGWLHKDYGRPGPTLTEWRKEHEHDHWQKENG